MSTRASVRARTRGWPIPPIPGGVGRAGGLWPPRPPRKIPGRPQPG
ncbi:MAG: hypothetical protein MZV63_64560 [Marinilabiliales bacterium]|nr:hypothetical protein [Marinilabiliales bacterium]